MTFAMGGVPHAGSRHSCLVWRVMGVWGEKIQAGLSHQLHARWGADLGISRHCGLLSPSGAEFSGQSFPTLRFPQRGQLCFLRLDPTFAYAEASFLMTFAMGGVPHAGSE